MLEFFEEQRNSWALAKKNYDDLQGVKTRKLTLSTGAEITLQCNPARIVSTAAKIDKEALAKRPCFLCEQNRPKEQRALSLQTMLPANSGELNQPPTLSKEAQGLISASRARRLRRRVPSTLAPLTPLTPRITDSFELLINPFPILPIHFTMPSKKHERQQLKPYFPVMLDFLDNSPETVDAAIFYNGPHSGASAPDHMHFQVGLVKDIPYYNNRKQWPGATLTITNEDKQKVIAEFYRIYDNLPIPTLEYEPMFNVFARKTDGKYEATLFLRSQHRPACYGMDDEQTAAQPAADSMIGSRQLSQKSHHRLISPGALDMAGLLITPQLKDFDTMTAEEAEAIYNEVSAPELLDYLNYNLTHHGRKIAVGLVETEKEIRFTLNGDFKRLTLLGDTFFIPQNDKATFTIESVVIGVNFHWQQERNLTYSGILKLAKTPDGKNVAINILPIEDYLKSVISSEMSAMSDFELLKAHAILSRSWLLANIEAKATHPHKKVDAEASLVWYDRSSHDIYDVCADDHCQRYQGVTMQTSPLVEKAVEATRGIVLKHQGKVCDARFSKCCGGRTELYEYCWDDTHIPYLESVECPYCNTAEQFDTKEEEQEVLSQVLNDYDLTTRNFYRWTATYTNPDIKEIIPLERGKSGRLWKIKLIFQDGREEIVGKELEIRRRLSDSHLYSSWFNVHKQPQTFLLEGRGWGHGVGLCQIGAAVMAHKGFTYDQILLHYFPSAILSPL